MAPFTAEYRANFSDTDAAGIVHFSTMFFWGNISWPPTIGFLAKAENANKTRERRVLSLMLLYTKCSHNRMIHCFR